ncbi:MAG: ABC transporter permease [Eubacteriales bacterium]|nr:ABC transporter permease [Eubacteriales bacterium]MDD4541199.1 ABC transporter permease [Eubacteriales bacterium]
MDLGSFLSSTIRLATPTLLAALGILISERSGVLNIGTEGMMLVGALAGVLGSYYTGSIWLGTLIGILITVAFAAIFGIFTVIVKADQTVVGTGMNILAAGLTITANRAVFGASASPPKIETFDIVQIPLLKDIPILGESLFSQTIPGYLALIMVFATAFFLFRTNTGLKVRSVGENPQACDTVGINVSKVRFLSVLYSGVMAGLAGAYISMGQLSFFTEGMIAGGGFMAVAAVVFGNYTPFGVLGASLVFGLSNASSYRLQALSTGIPSEFPNMLPYVITIVALCITSRRSKKPASSAVPYVKG